MKPRLVCHRTATLKEQEHSQFYRRQDLRSVISQVGKLLQEKRATQGTNSYDVLDLEVALERLKIVDDRERQYSTHLSHAPVDTS